ncbi:hypothetical protein [Pseudarthrobacter albicanus]|uniref:hypothetical protein n=1 Tax=Pseudarthrobacter albicanus TaxID=2823873 RepID=UPI001BAAF81D|nr:hypothetical protein [Pseudarthrobacter albicanus]
MADGELAGIAGQLYGLPFDDFVGARTAAAKEVAGEVPAGQEQRSLATEVRSLPKPSVGAWAVNMLAALRPGTLRELAELGQSMRAAQSALDAAELRRLGQERRLLLNLAVKAARAVAEQQGRKISDAVATEVEQTLRAATADEGAAAAVRSGRLLRTLSADGVDVVDLAGAVAVPAGAGPAGAAAAGAAPSGAVPAAAAGKRPAEQPAEQPRLRAVREAPRRPAPSARERAQAGLRDAEEAARSAVREGRRYEAELAEATAAAATLAEETQSLREQLERAEEELKAARKRRDVAAARAQQAARAADKERRKEDLARERVLRLGNTPE